VAHRCATAPLEPAVPAFQAAGSGKPLSEDPLPQPPYVVLDPPPVHGVPVQVIVLGSVHRVVSNLPLGSGVCAHQVLTGSPDPRQLPFGPGSARIRPVIQGAIRRRCRSCGPWFPAALSAVGIGLLGHPAPAGELRLPHGRPTGHRWPDPNGVVVLRMSKPRPGRAPPLPRGRWCAPGRRLSSGRHPPLCCGQSLRPRWNIPSAGVTFTRRHQGFTRVRPSPPGS
jgi:hypothetical protein